MDDFGNDVFEEIKLTPREVAVAKKAADLAVKQMTDNFYKDVGRTVVNKILILMGAIAVGWFGAKGLKF